MSDADQDEEGARPRGGDGPSEKQLNFIASLQKRIGLGEDELEEILQDAAQVGTVEELDRKSASIVIDQLMIEAKDRGVDLDSQPKASDKQVGFMKQLKRRAHLTDEEFAKFLEERAGVSEPEEVGKRDASTIIDELLKLANDGGAKGGAKAGGAKAGGAPGSSTAEKPARKKAPPKGGAPGAGVVEAPPAKGKAKKKAEPAPAAAQDDEDRPPDRAPPPDDPEPGSFDDETDDRDLDRDPGPGDRPPDDDDDLPF